VRIKRRRDNKQR
jgi:hypothetical protein